MKRSEFDAILQRKTVMSTFGQKISLLADLSQNEFRSCDDIEVLRSKLCDAGVHLQRAIEVFLSDDDEK